MLVAVEQPALGSGEWTVVGVKGKPKKISSNHINTCNPSSCAASPGHTRKATGTETGLGHSKPESRVTSGNDASSSHQCLPGWSQDTSLGHKPCDSTTRLHSTRRRKRGVRTPEEQVADIASSIAAAQAEISKSPFYDSLLRAVQQGQQVYSNSATEAVWDWSSVEEMVIFGLGSLEYGPVSRYQLALALLLRDRLPGLRQSVRVFDPIFTPTDKQVLAAVGCEVLEKDEEGRRTASRQTLFYLPHCELQLCENLLAANWSLQNLQRMAILGNSLSMYEQRWSKPTAHQMESLRPVHVLAAAADSSAVEVPVNDHRFAIASAFNDMALHLFPLQQLPVT